MKRLYLDNSVINRIYRDPSMQECLVFIPEVFTIFLSTYSIAELCATPDRETRINLLKIAKTIAGEYRPAAMPGELLCIVAKAFQNGNNAPNQSMSEQWNGAWEAFNKPELIDEEALDEVNSWKEAQENWFDDMFSEAREHFQSELKKYSGKDRDRFSRKYSALAKYYISNSEFLYNYIQEHLEKGCKISADKQFAIFLLENSEHWRLFLSSMGYGLFCRTLRTEKYSRRSTPGGIDTLQAIYLAICDIFTTADIEQYRMLRNIKPLAIHPKIIWTYDHLKRFILENCDCV